MPSDTTLTHDPGLTTAVASWPEPSATDTCGPVTLTSNYDSGTSFAIGTTTVTYTATDQFGNIATASFTIMVTGM